MDFVGGYATERTSVIFTGFSGDDGYLYDDADDFISSFDYTVTNTTELETGTLYTIDPVFGTLDHYLYWVRDNGGVNGNGEAVNAISLYLWPDENISAEQRKEIAESFVFTSFAE